MKRKLLLLVLVAVLAVSLFVIVACNQDEGDKHQHTYSEEWTFDETSHWHAATCEHSDKINGKRNHYFGNNGICSVCGYASEYLHVHPQLVYCAAREETCTEDGNVEYWHCEVCKRNYADQFGMELLNSVAIPASHDEIRIDAQNATCVKRGFSAYVMCTRCDYVTDHDETNPLGHKFNSGICSVCGTVNWTYPGTDIMELSNSRYGYNFFDTVVNGAAMQGLYDAINEAVVAVHNNVEDDYDADVAFAELNLKAFNLTEKEAVAVYKTYYNDNPLFYWLSNSVNAHDGILYLYIDTDYVEGATRAKCNQLVLTKIQQFALYTECETSAYQIALAYHDRIISTIDYAYDASGYPEVARWAHSILGVFEAKGGVCESYAKTFQLMLNVRGVENIIVDGVGYTENGSEAHAWNMVKLDDGQWYWCDLTWDDTTDGWGINYQYFCVNDAQNVNWSDGIPAGFSGGIPNVPEGVKTFLDQHVAYASTGSDIEFLYDLPSRSMTVYAGEANELLLRDSFKIAGLQYAVNGYRTVQLTEVTRAGKVIIPETVKFKGETYTVISVGIMDENKLFCNGMVFPWPQSVTSVSIPSTVKFIWDFAFENDSFEEITVAEDNPTFRSLDGVLYTKNLYTLISYPAANKRTSFTIPDETRHVAYMAFWTCGYLQNISVGANVEKVGVVHWGSGYYDSDLPPHEGGGYSYRVVWAVSGGWRAMLGALTGSRSITVSQDNKTFWVEDGAIYGKPEQNPLGGQANLVLILDEQITTFEIKKNVWNIDDVFTEFTYMNLQSLTVEEGNEYYSAVDGVLYNKEQTKIVTVPNAIKGHVVIPDTITSIDWPLFTHHKGLTGVTIGSSVTEIDEYAFYGCDLSEIIYKGTKAQWNAIVKGDRWHSEDVTITVHCTDGDIII